MWYQVLELQTQPSKADDTWHLCEKNSTPEWLRTVLWSAWRRVRVVCSVSVLRPVFVSSCLVLCVLCLVLSCHGAGSTRPRLPWRQQHKAPPLENDFQARLQKRASGCLPEKARGAPRERPQRERPQRTARPCQRTAQRERARSPRGATISAMCGCTMILCHDRAPPQPKLQHVPLGQSSPRTHER